MIFMKERIGKMLEYIKERIYPESVPIDRYEMCRMIGGKKQTPRTYTFSSGEIWGGHREYFEFETSVEIPDHFAGECVVYELLTGKEGGWDATNPQFSIYVNGERRQGLDVNHREVILTERARAKEVFAIRLSAFTGDQNFSLRLDSKIKVLDRKTEAYFYDLSVPYETARLLDPDDEAYMIIIRALNDSLNLLDMRQEKGRAYEESLERAHNHLKDHFYSVCCDPEKKPVIRCVGHTHIDCAWLWTLRVTEDKAVRSFSTVLALMEQYPEYVFMSSQPQLYQYVKKNAPDVYRRIKDRIREGRWEPEGGMFVEADCNLASGEALVRQFLLGKTFFREEFGKDNRILWLPDVFGYSAALPQIMQKCGIRYFMTTKISWNEMNKMPCDTFMWEGIDGSRVLTHFIPTRDYRKAAVEGGTETEHFTTYNGYLEPVQMKGAWSRYSQKELNKEVLCSFGYGDGGGGPTREQLENQRRMARGIPGCPRTQLSTAGEFFDKLNQDVREDQYLPVWSGELYLEYHRGTYTSMARNKRYNRKSEFAYQNAEMYAVMANRLSGVPYPAETLREGWEAILRNQFHDILPGSSIREVYDDSKEEYEKLLAAGRHMTAESLRSIAARIHTPTDAVIVFNPNSKCAPEITSFRCPSHILRPVLMDDGRKVGLQKIKEDTWIFTAAGVPSKGYKTYRLEDEVNIEGTCCLSELSDAVGMCAVSEPIDVSGAVDVWGLIDASGELHISAEHMENQWFSIDYNEKGQFARIYDKRARRNILKPGRCANVIVSYEDRPHNYDAWDVNHYYTEKSWEIDHVSSIEVIEEGPVRGGIRIVREYLDSVIEQNVYIYRDIPRIDIRNVIDWHEHQQFVKAHFPLDVHTNEAVFDIQYGNVKRYTHTNTSWDFARFEVCHHKWLDVAEDGYGVSILNDCKYGVSVNGTDVGLSMLKSAIYPNPTADQERHEFVYSIYPHEGDWREADTVGQAYSLNNPVTSVVKEKAEENTKEKAKEKGTFGGGLRAGESPDPCYSFLSIDRENVIIEAVKMAESGDGLIVRLYECYNRRGDVTLTCAEEVEQMWECTMMEEIEREVGHTNHHAALSFRPFEIKTLKIRLK